MTNKPKQTIDGVPSQNKTSPLQVIKDYLSVFEDYFTELFVFKNLKS